MPRWNAKHVRDERTFYLVHGTLYSDRHKLLPMPGSLHTLSKRLWYIYSCAHMAKTTPNRRISRGFTRTVHGLVRVCSATRNHDRYHCYRAAETGIQTCFQLLASVFIWQMVNKSHFLPVHMFSPVLSSVPNVLAQYGYGTGATAHPATTPLMYFVRFICPDEESKSATKSRAFLRDIYLSNFPTNIHADFIPEKKKSTLEYCTLRHTGEKSNITDVVQYCQQSDICTRIPQITATSAQR